MKNKTKALSILLLITLAFFLTVLYGCSHEPQKYMIDKQKTQQPIGTSDTATEQYQEKQDPEKISEEETDFISCEGKFWGKSVCPAEYEPVCAILAETDIITNETLRTERRTFNNACYACTYTKESLRPTGYTEGKC